MTRLDDGLYTALLQRGVSRRSFLKFSAAMAAALALPASYAPRIARAVATAPRLPVIWLRGQDCAGNTAAFLRATSPSISELVLDLLSVDYHQTLMAPAGAAADLSRTTTMEKYPRGYLAIVEGGIPTADGGVHCTIGGRAFRDIVREVCDGAVATIAVGACAFDGGTPAAAGGPTGAVGVAGVVPDGRLITLPGGGAGPSSPMAASSTTSASGAPTSSSASSSLPGVTRVPRRAGASTRWAARDRRRSRTARRSASAGEPAGRSRRDMAASAARCRASGTP